MSSSLAPGRLFKPAIQLDWSATPATRKRHLRIFILGSTQPGRGGSAAVREPCPQNPACSSFQGTIQQNIPARYLGSNKDGGAAGEHGRQALDAGGNQLFLQLPDETIVSVAVNKAQQVETQAVKALLSDDPFLDRPFADAAQKKAVASRTRVRVFGSFHNSSLVEVGSDTGWVHTSLLH